MRRQALPSGRYAVLHGQEFRIVSGNDGRQALTSSQPYPDFERRFNGFYRYWPADNEWLECVVYRSHGTYRGWDVGVSPNGQGRLVLGLDTSDRRRPETDADADALGFDFREPGVWTKIVEPDDPDLDVVTTRTPINPPWITEGEDRS